MNTDEIWAGHRHITGQHQFCIFSEEFDEQPLLEVRAGVPITVAMAAAETIFECVAEFEHERLQYRQQNQMSEWASRWLLTIAEALVVSVRKGNIGAELKRR